MSAVKPYTVGSTVKWRENDIEYAGIIASVRVDTKAPGATSQEEDGLLESLETEGLEPVYVITLSDHSVVFKHHRDLVLV